MHLRGTRDDGWATRFARVKEFLECSQQGFKRFIRVCKAKLRAIWLIISCSGVPTVRQSENWLTIFVQRHQKGLSGEQQEPVRGSTPTLVEVGMLRIVEYVPPNSESRDEESAPSRDSPQDRPDADNELDGVPQQLMEQ